MGTAVMPLPEGQKANVHSTRVLSSSNGHLDPDVCMMMTMVMMMMMVIIIIMGLVVFQVQIALRRGRELEGNHGMQARLLAQRCQRSH
mmetsp:Transcript_71283/g.131414  ORF Transcript_71283/g.131414 Transcript_71283/m.131414 type:complete len:88 (+) Transcript_71283:497-760(+)